jgi:DNA-binding CsgD family transcriptional regulator
MPHPYSHTHLYWRSRNVFRLLYEHLARRFQLVCYDSRGLGSSGRGLPEDFTIDQFETDLEAVVDLIDLKRFVLLAQTGFCRVAVRYATKHQERVSALILWNPDTGDPSRDSWEPGQIAALGATNWELFVDMMARTGWIPEDPIVARNLIRESITQEDWLIRSRAWPKYKVADTVASVRAPTLLLAASRSASPYSSEAASRCIASQVKGARLEILDDPGTGLFTLQPEVPAGVLLIEEFVRTVLPAVAQASVPVAGFPALSEREIEVLRLVAAGKSNQEIADELVISVNTVIRHVSNIFAKTGATNRAQATAFAKDRGIA